MTHRQYLAWMEWEAESKNTPGLNEYYIAQATAEIRRVMSTRPSSIKIEDFILEFRNKDDISPEHMKNVNNVAKLNWSKRMTMPIRIITKEEAVYVYPPGHPDAPDVE